MMKRGREEDATATTATTTAMKPLFSRLHVSDAVDRKGPRAPPRNKMALYEQLSVPIAPRHDKVGFLEPSTSSGQGCGRERSFFSPFYVSPHKSPHLAESLHSRSSDEVNHNTTKMEFERRSIKHASNRTLGATGSVAECSLPRLLDNSSANSSCKKSLDEDNLMVPTCFQSGVTLYSSKDTAIVGPEKLPSFYTRSPQKSCSAAFNCLIQFPDSGDKPSEETNTCDMKSMKYNRNHNDEKCKENSIFKELTEKSASYSGSGEKFAVLSNFAKPSLGHDRTATSNGFQSTRYGNARLDQESSYHDALVGPRFLNDSDVENDDTPRVRNESCPQASVGNIGDMLNVSDKGNKVSDDKTNVLFETRETQKIEVSESTMIDSIQGIEISPDDVVGVMGPKYFWKARSAIVKQQKIFVQQVFELHRLIKVQKLIASSPDVLIKGHSYLSSLPKVPTKSRSPEHMVKSDLQIVEQKDGSQQPNKNTKSPKENTVGATPLPSCEEVFSKELSGQGPRNGTYSENLRNEAYPGNPPVVPLTTNNKASPWCFHPPPNQWLVPVMSPSEGLVYKPYTGSCPPTSGFVAPVYGSCTPLAGDFMHTGYGVPTSHQQQNMNMGSFPGTPAISPSYFRTPAVRPVVNPITSASAVEQVIPLVRPQLHGHAEQHSRSSCNMSNPKREAFSGYARMFQASKDSELQGSTGSSPCEKGREGRDALPLFPTAPTGEGSTQPSASCEKDNQARVIKVVPRNARSATESAAMIFRSIQEERRQCGS